MRDTEGRATVGTERPAKAAEDCTPHVLVVGATRVLRPSVRALVARGTAVTA
ncbi:hypothetical protein GA0115251_14401, partial [Streptomyces sp. TverLS-915]